MKDVDLQALADGNVADLKKKLPELDREQLTKLRNIEAGKGEESRSTAMTAIEAAIADFDAVEGDGSASQQGGGASGDDSGSQQGDASSGDDGRSDVRDDDEHPVADVVDEDDDERPSAHIETGEGTARPVTPAPSASSVTAPIAGDGTPNLDGMDLQTLEALRNSEVNGASRASVLDAIAARIDELRADAAKALEVDPSRVASRIVATSRSVDAATKRATSIAFAESPNRIEHIEPIETAPGMFSVTGGRVLLDRKITVSGQIDPANITHVLLLDDEDDVAGVCELTMPVRVGGGREVEFPAGSLTF